MEGSARFSQDFWGNFADETTEAKEETRSGGLTRVLQGGEVIDARPTIVFP